MDRLPIVLVIAAALLYASALPKAHFLIQHSGEYGRSWRRLFGLVIFALAGFPPLAWLLWHQPHRGMGALLSALESLSAGLFVAVSVRVNAGTVRHLMEMARIQRENALRDALTGLPNRTLLMERLRHDLQLGARQGITVTVLMMDLNHFKDINDALGHEAGDNLLITLAPRLAACVRQSDLLGRLGGDEFAAVLPGCSGEEAQRIADKLSEATLQPIELEGKLHHISVSIGIAEYPRHGTDASQLLRRADLAMYHGKRSGVAVTLYREDMAPAAVGQPAVQAQ